MSFINSIQTVSHTVPAASAATALLFLTAAKGIIAALNAYSQAVNQRVRDFTPGGIVYLLHSSAGYLHIPRTFFLREAFFIDQAYRFVFIDCQDDRLSGTSDRIEFTDHGQTANFSAFSRSRHRLSLSYVIDICPLLWYDINCF